MHEHIFVLTPDVQQNYQGEWHEEERLADAVARLSRLAALGVDTIVDPTVVGLGRYIPRIQRVNEHVDMNIVVATGIYTYSDVPFYFHYRRPAAGEFGLDPMVELFVRDLTSGIADTGVRAAFLKCAIDSKGLTPGVERILRAVAVAHRQTGAPIMVHTHPQTRRGLDAARVLSEQGVDPGRVQLAHSGDTTDIDHLSELAEAGYLLGMDRFGVDSIMPTSERVSVVVEMVRRGYAGQLVLSHDASCYIDWISPAAREATLPHWHYEHIPSTVLPALRARGVTERQLTQMLVDNARTYFDPPPRLQRREDRAAPPTR